MAESRSDWTVLQMLEWATGYFEDKEITNARLSIEWLLSFVLKVKRLDLYLMFDRPLTEDELQVLRPLVKRRALHEPLQYILGEADFYGFTFEVKPGVLIPRPETEQLVELILNDHQESKDLQVLDVGTGSGCIPIALKKKRDDWTLRATDISEDALSIAKANAAKLNADVHFLLDDLFNPSTEVLAQKVNVLASNPPYILESEKSGLDKEVKQFEPELALFCESTAKMYGALKKLGEKILAPSGAIYLELNERFGKEVIALFSDPIWDVQLIPDYAGKDRFLKGKIISKKTDF
ncbi:MAG: peptide chain release factor N(5)-glutamine methyltransferase [Balneolaceae bacterium]|nr:peptide chain release factor N(5)-glutamine methyltransferase [Balneolaceae bacterium]